MASSLLRDKAGSGIEEEAISPTLAADEFEKPPRVTSGDFREEPSKINKETAKSEYHPMNNSRTWKQFGRYRGSGGHSLHGIGCWRPEILSCLLALLCVIVIVVVLATYEGRLAPEWPLSLSLNAFLAFFTSLGKIALLYPVMQCFGQMRWLRFSAKDRKLSEFEAFENASRGIYGSFKLLATMKGGKLASLGAFLIVASLFTSPLTQQAILYPTRLAPIDNAAAAPIITVLEQNSSQFYGPSGNLSDLTEEVLQFKRSVIGGAYYTGDPLENMPPKCTSGDCTFPDFVSLGVCTKMNDVSKYLIVKQESDRDWAYNGLNDNRTWSATLPIVPQSRKLIVPTLRSIGIFMSANATSLSFSDSEVETALADVYIIYSNAAPYGGKNVTFQAVEVLFQFCSKAFSLQVSGGTTRWKELARSSAVESNNASTLNFLQAPDYLRCIYGVDIETCMSQFGRTRISAPAGFESHHGVEIEQVTGLGVSSSLQESFWDGVTSPPWITRNQTTDYVSFGGMFLLGLSAYRVQGDITYALGSLLWPSVLFDAGNPSKQTPAIAKFMDNIATGMDNSLRSNIKFLSNNAPPVSGQTLGEVPYVQIRWPWLLFLLLELMIAIVFLVVTIIITRRAKVQIMKGSSLPTMCALDEETRGRLGTMNDFTLLQSRAADLDVRLERDKSGAILGLRSIRARPLE